MRDLRQAIQSDASAITVGLAVAGYFLIAGVRHGLWAVVIVSPILGLVGAEFVHAIREYWPRR